MKMITAYGDKLLSVGDVISFDVPDNRKLPRFVCWLLRRPPPTRRHQYQITKQMSSNDFDIAPLQQALGITELKETP